MSALRRTGAPLARPEQASEPVPVLRRYIEELVAARRKHADTIAAEVEARRARDVRVVAALRAGLTLAQAAEAAGMSASNVRVIARAAGISLPKGPRPRKRAT